MVATPSTDPNQGFGPIPAISQHIEFTGDWQSKDSDDLLGQDDFALKGTTPSRPFRMIKLGPQGQKKLLVEQGRQNPLVAKAAGLLGMVPMPTTARDLLACLFNQAVIHDKKEDIPGRDPQRLEELTQGDLPNLLRRPNTLSQESSKTRERSPQERMGHRLYHGGGVDFFAQLNEADDKGREDLKRRS